MELRLSSSQATRRCGPDAFRSFLHSHREEDSRSGPSSLFQDSAGPLARNVLSDSRTVAWRKTRERHMHSCPPKKRAPHSSSEGELLERRGGKKVNPIEQE